MNVKMIVRNLFRGPNVLLCIVYTSEKNDKKGNLYEEEKHRFSPGGCTASSGDCTTSSNN